MTLALVPHTTGGVGDDGETVGGLGRRSHYACGVISVAVVLATLVLLPTQPASAAERHVGPDQAFSRIQDAVAAAQPGDQILVHPQPGNAAYRRVALARFVALPPSALERRERLEQLRALANGMRIDVVVVDAVPLGVDTPDDLARARALPVP